MRTNPRRLPKRVSAAKSVGVKKRGAKKKTMGGGKKGAAGAFSASDNIQTIDRDTVMINGIMIDIEKITDEQLYSLRKILPRKDYR
jgi:hypothetical protein